MEHWHRELLQPVRETHKYKTTWLNLYDYFASNLNVPIDFWYDDDRPNGDYKNRFYDPLFTRRFNVVAEERRGEDKVRLLILRSLLDVEPKYKRLCHHQGRPIWAYNLRYEGKTGNQRVLSFNLKQEKKRFFIPENYVLYLEDDRFVSPQSYLFATSQRLPIGTFGSPFYSKKCLTNMFLNQSEFTSYDSLEQYVEADSTIRVGSLVQPRIGLFSPDFRYRRTLLTYLIDLYVDRTGQSEETKTILGRYHNDRWLKEKSMEVYRDFLNWCREDADALFPLGLVIADEQGNHSEERKEQGVKTYTVRFGQTIYEGVAPFQIEVVT